MTTTTRADAVHVSIHMAIEPGHMIPSRHSHREYEATVALWARSTYADDYAPHVTLHAADIGPLATPDPLPSWVPRPPAAWLAITDELRVEVTR